MSDIFQEVDEEVRREQLKKLWERYGNLLVAAMIVVLVAVAGWRGYEWWQNRKSAEIGAKFDTAAVLFDQDKAAEAATAFDELAKSATPGYRMLAQLRAAEALAKSDPKSAVATYDAVANDSSVDRGLRDLAAIRAAMLLVDDAPYGDIAARLEPLAGPTKAFRHSARELLALSAWRNKDGAAAQRWFDIVTADAETPPSVRARIDILMALSSDVAKG